MQALPGWRDQQPGLGDWSRADFTEQLRAGPARALVGRLVLLVLIAPFWLLGKLLGGPRRRRR